MYNVKEYPDLDASALLGRKDTKAPRFAKKK